MEYHFKNQDELKQFIAEEVLTSKETIDVLGISRARLSQLISNGKLVPIKKAGKDSWFLKSDILKKRKELDALRSKYRPYDN